MNYFHKQLGLTIHCTTYNHDNRTKEDPGTPLEEIQGPTIIEQTIDAQLNLKTKGTKIPMVLNQWSWMQRNNNDPSSLKKRESKEETISYALHVEDQDTCQRTAGSNRTLGHHNNNQINNKQ